MTESKDEARRLANIEHNRVYEAKNPKADVVIGRSERAHKTLADLRAEKDRSGMTWSEFFDDMMIVYRKNKR